MFLSRLIARSVAPSLRLRNTASFKSHSRFLSSYSGESITYSGGQATEGQGGFYGSGGARAEAGSSQPSVVEDQRPSMLALASDVQKIENVMKEVSSLENLLEAEGTEVVNNVTIELRSSIKKLMTAPDFMESLGRLELKGEPIWGLSSDERELIVTARNKMNEC
eukprot:CAMPEP_0118710118 /NCGR_PEP_ID=MMETSP0800-20121206/23146_1 /TAXON_ID=210618 ORGANISM="Striatella unipunctata, Strain CCMP2910" /NCGR_SAMPLE_ID=MMETSP0800 /ASSEMBLY_ACC=CAM_ASM_000638 /LENGTH=164 /DNA_ID=CAMNT_0006614149 /DNA_START=24 /DNA_END=518 /DNA_ORIENTATION=+